MTVTVALGRRAALTTLAGLAGAVMAPASPKALLVAADDERLSTETVSFPAASGTMQGYLVRPAGFPDPLPSVVVVHESNGLHPHIRDLTRRIGLAGYMAMAPDMLSSRGGTPADAAATREIVNALPGDTVVADLVAAMIYLQTRPDGAPRVGAMGFGWGGGAALRLATVAPVLGAVVSFYGKAPKADDALRIRTPLLLHYAALDAKTNQGIATFEDALREAGARYAVHTYAGVNQGFTNDAIPSRYNARESELAWSRTVDFLKQSLG
jgi:carboxymethylenebutenolidase